MALDAIVETHRTVRTAIILQRMLAVPLAIGSMFFVLAVIGLFCEALDGGWRALIAIPVVAAVATAPGSVSLSLFRGFGVNGRPKPVSDGRVKTSHLRQRRDCHAPFSSPLAEGATVWKTYSEWLQWLTS